VVPNPDILSLPSPPQSGTFQLATVVRGLARPGSKPWVRNPLFNGGRATRDRNGDPTRATQSELQRCVGGAPGCDRSCQPIGLCWPSVIAPRTLSPCCTAQGVAHRSQGRFRSGCGSSIPTDVDRGLAGGPSPANPRPGAARSTACSIHCRKWTNRPTALHVPRGPCVAAASEAGHVVTKRMSQHSRNERKCQQRHRCGAGCSSEPGSISLWALGIPCRGGVSSGPLGSQKAFALGGNSYRAPLPKSW